MPWLRGIVLMLLSTAAGGTERSYPLSAETIVEGSYLVRGSTAHFSMHNGGNIANAAFIDTADGVVVIDTGPSALYGAALRRLAESTTGKAIVRVYNTHHHPDHFLGNQAFADVPIFALAGTREGMIEQAEAFNDNLYRLLGTWMKGTVPHLPNHDAAPGRESIGGHELEFFAYRGHTRGDLVILDHTTGILYAGDLVFHDRAPTTPNADINAWRTSLAGLRGTRYRYLVPGHGAVVTNDAAISATSDYLTWLHGRITDAVTGGRDMAETLFLPVPRRFHTMDTLTEEYRRSVMHVFPDIEHEYFHGE